MILSLDMASSFFLHERRFLVSALNLEFIVTPFDSSKNLRFLLLKTLIWILHTIHI